MSLTNIRNALYASSLKFKLSIIGLVISLALMAIFGHLMPTDTCEQSTYRSGYIYSFIAADIFLILALCFSVLHGISGIRNLLFRITLGTICTIVIAGTCLIVGWFALFFVNFCF